MTRAPFKTTAEDLAQDEYALRRRFWKAETAEQIADLCAEEYRLDCAKQAHRARLIEFCEGWQGGELARQYAPQIGHSGLGYPLKLDDLTDAALEELARRIIRDFWFHRRLRRQNREVLRRRA